jgi:hypothetical protein
MSDLKTFLKDIDLSEELADKPDELKEKFHELFVARSLADTDEEIASKVVGKRLGAITTLAKREFGLESSEIEGKKVEEILSIGASKFKTKVEELTKAAEGKNPEAAEWEKKLKAIETEREQFKRMAEEKQSEFEAFKNEATTKEKNLRLNYALTGIKSKIEWSDTANEIAKKGFDAHLKEVYSFDLNDKGELIATDANGQPVQNAKKTGFLTPEEVIKTEALKFNLLKLSNPPSGGAGDGKGTPPQKPMPAAKASPYGDQPLRKLPTKAQEIAQRK